MEPIAVLSQKELSTMLKQAAAEGARQAIAASRAFELDLPVSKIRARLKCKDNPKRWGEILLATGAKPNRREGLIDFYFLSLFSEFL